MRNDGWDDGATGPRGDSCSIRAVARRGARGDLGSSMRSMVRCGADGKCNAEGDGDLTTLPTLGVLPRAPYNASMFRRILAFSASRSVLDGSMPKFRVLAAVN